MCSVRVATVSEDSKFIYSYPIGALIWKRILIHPRNDKIPVHPRVMTKLMVIVHWSLGIFYPFTIPVVNGLCAVHSLPDDSCEGCRVVNGTETVHYGVFTFPWFFG